MRPEHKDQIIRWANFARENPTKAKAAVKTLIDSQFAMSKRFYDRLKQTAAGRKTFENLRKHMASKSKKQAL